MLKKIAGPVSLAGVLTFVGAFLILTLVSCSLPSEIQYQCQSDAADTVSLQDTVTATCTKQ